MKQTKQLNKKINKTKGANKQNRASKTNIHNEIKQTKETGGETKTTEEKKHNRSRNKNIPRQVHETNKTVE
jgi:hypothetical protein